MKAILTTMVLLLISGTLQARIRYDVTFHDDGIQTGPYLNFDGRAITADIHVLPDGKILVAGSVNTDPTNFLEITGVLVKLNADGSRDVGFGNAGVFYFQFDTTSTNPQTFFTSMAVQLDGKILLAGYSNSSDPADSFRGTLVRVNPNGTLDSAFAGDGSYRSPNKQNANIEGRSIYHAVEVLPDGSIVTAGNVLYGNLTTETCHTPQSPWCSATSLFSTNGLFQSRISHKLSPESGMREYINDLEVLPDGKLIGAVASETGDAPFRIARFSAGGALDTGYGIQGVVSLLGLDDGQTTMSYGVAVQPDGKVVVSGRRQGDVITGRVNTNGTLDQTYGSGGISQVVNPITNANAGADVLILPDGRILSTGTNKIVRFLPNGTRDTAFGPDGEVDIEPVQTNDIGTVYPTRLGRDRKGKIAFSARTTLLEPGSGPVDNWAVGRVTNGTTGRFDFDGDSRTDVSIFRPSVGQWWYLQSSNNNDNRAFQFATPDAVPVPADFTGDGISDIAFWRETTGDWFVLRSEDQSFFSFPFGSSGDIPAPGDFDGDGKADPAVFRPSSGTWFISRTTGGTDIIPFGVNGDRPIVEDYDGDGKDDIAIFRPSVSQWWLLQSLQGVKAYQFGAAGDVAVPADFTADGRADVAFFRQSTGEWYVLRSEDETFFAYPFGASGDLPVPGDYDGDGQVDPAVFRPSSNTWFRLRSTNGFDAIPFGVAGDVPVPGVYSAQ
ncbi:MAG: hypothetical protein J5I65_15065 [Aridibacter famidurans]|nr:hypothetical protein [Aridibacter famidurans]